MRSLPPRPLVRTNPETSGRGSQRKLLERWRRTAGAVIGAAIKDSDRKQIEVAKALGISENVLSEIVQGHRKTELGEIVLIAKAIDEDPLVLIRRILSWNG